MEKTNRDGKARKLSISELSEYCKSRGYNRFIYSQNNQNVDELFTPLQVFGEYNKVLTFFAPASVCFIADDRNKLRLSGAKYAIVNDDPKKTQAEITVVCNSFQNDGSTRQFTIHANRL